MSLFAFAPSRGPRWQLRLQAALGISVPIAVMTLAGMPTLLTGAATRQTGSMEVALERVIDTVAGSALGAVSGVLHPRTTGRENAQE